MTNENYKSLLEKAKKAYDNCVTGAEKRRLESIFPELKENEEEKIRKALIEMVHDITGNELWVNYNIQKEDALNWLEKQAEQNPDDKPEPKFKVGDWVVNNRTSKIYKIDSIDAKDANYITYSCVPSIYANEDLPCFSESMIHLWTIQDAKDGDVLYSYDKNILWIYKDTKTYYVAMLLDYIKYGGIVINCDIVIPLDTCPATKEQRDLLFQTIKESGYTWNAEKKELK